jgi:hypothetical protein
MQEVEKAGADLLLTESINLLAKAKDLVGDYIDKPKPNFTDIRSFEDACKALDIDPDSVCSDVDTSDEVAYKQLKKIVQAINQGWTPDWSNTNQRKWYPWFNLSSGFGFDVSDFDFVYSNAGVGSRLCFESEEKADYAGRQFLEIYRQFMTVTN